MVAKLSDIIFIEKFEPDDEAAYQKQNLKQFAPLLPLIMVAGLLIVIGMQFWDLTLDADALTSTGPVRLALIVHLLICIALTLYPPTHANRRNWLFFCLYLYFGSGVGLAATLALLPGGPVAGVAALILGTIAAPIIVRGAAQAVVVLVFYLTVIVVTMAAMDVSRFQITNVIWWVGVSSALAVFFAHLFDVVNRREFRLAKLLETARLRTDHLLLNLMPENIATRLKNGEELIADRHDSVSVLFADLAGFTDLSLHLSASELVVLLNDLFSRFDHIVGQNGAEKIKIIGDAYMASAGLFDRTGNHADQIADTALQMQQAVTEFSEQSGHDLKLRIGVHSGPVVAGVIGKRKLAYDLWGNTVNIANSMETKGVTGKIQLSVETRDMLSDRFRTTRRGEVKIKGQSARTTYILEGLAG